MRLLFINHNLIEHGTWFRAFHLARELARLGHEATVWTASADHWYRATEGTLEGVRVIQTPSWNPVLNRDEGWGPLDLLWRLTHAAAARADLVYAFAHPPTVYLPARLAQVLRRRPMVADWCDVYRDGIFPQREKIRAYTGGAGEAGWRLALHRRAERIESVMERRILRRADGVTVISRYLEDAALDAGVNPARLLRIPSGANTEAIVPRDKAECRRELGIGEGLAGPISGPAPGPILGYVANYNPDERFFLEALGRVFARRPGARLLAACPEFTPSVVRETGTGGNLIMLGRQPFSRMSTVLGAADVLLLPLEDNISNRGRWPNKFGDYLAAGRPIAANAIGDVADYFPDGARGRAGGHDAAIGALAPCDPAAFADEIVGLMDRPDDWEAMGRSARALAEGPLGWASLAREAETFLNKFI